MSFCVNKFEVGVNDGIFSGNEQEKVYMLRRAWIPDHATTLCVYNIGLFMIYNIGYTSIDVNRGKMFFLKHHGILKKCRTWTGIF